MTTDQPQHLPTSHALDQTREQIYACRIHEQVVAFRNATLNQEDRDAYKAMVQSLPVLVRTAGLAQALAFVQTRSKEAQRLILAHLNDLFQGDLSAEQTLLDLSREARMGEYMYVTRQVMSALLWYKRFAEWLLDKDRVATAQPPAPDAGGQAQPNPLPATTGGTS